MGLFARQTDKMAANSVFRLSCRNGRNKLLLFRGFYSGPRSILPSASIVKQQNRQRTLNTTVSSQVQKQLFELPKDAKQGAKHWLTERVVAVALLGAIPAGVLYPVPLVDHCLAVLLPLHAYWGVNAIIADYLYRPLVPVTKLAWAGTCVLTAAGLIYLNVNDVGIVKFVGMILN